MKEELALGLHVKVREEGGQDLALGLHVKVREEGGQMAVAYWPQGLMMMVMMLCDAEEKWAG